MNFGLLPTASPALLYMLVQADKSRRHRSVCGRRLKKLLWQSGKQSFPSLSPSPLFLQASRLIRENFPPYPFLGGLLSLALRQQEGVPTCAHGLEKIYISHTITAVLGAGGWGDARTCNVAESLYGQHVCSTPAITQSAAVFRGWQHCLHPITTWGWIQGKSLYLPGSTGSVMIDTLWLLEWRMNLSFKTCAFLCPSLMLHSPSFSHFPMQAEKRKTGKDWSSFIIILGDDGLSGVFCLCLRCCVY